VEPTNNQLHNSFDNIRKVNMYATVPETKDHFLPTHRCSHRAASASVIAFDKFIVEFGDEKGRLAAAPISYPAMPLVLRLSPCSAAG